jgi:RimJ/RimL family protein N-acetyltransferase
VTVAIRPLRPEDAAWVADKIRSRWGSDVVVSRGVVHRPVELPGFLAAVGKRRVGLLTYHVGPQGCEIVTIDAFEPRRGIGTALVEAVVALGHERIWLVTTNDNTPAQRFHERCGFELVAVHAGAVVRSRELKPEIPELGLGGVPIVDELEYEWRSAPGRA